MPPNTIQGQVTLGKMRELIAFEADQPTPSEGTYVTLHNYADITNRSYREVAGLMVDTFQDYFVNPDIPNPFTFITNGNDYQYDLPNDFWKGIGFDALQIPGNIQTACTMRPFSQLNRNQYQGLGPGAIVPQWVPQWKITGSKLWLIPMPPPQGLQILVRYVPFLPDMQDIGTITVTDVWEAGRGIAIASAPVIPNAAPVDGALPAVTDVLQFTTYTAVENTAIPVNTTYAKQFRKGTSPATAAQNLYNAMTNPLDYPTLPWASGSPAQDAASVAQVTISGATITIRLIAPMAIVWSGYASFFDPPRYIPAPNVAFSPLPVPSFTNPYGAWSNFCSVMNGFDELVIIDAAMKIVDRQEQPDRVATLEARKAAFIARIRSEANNRNAAQNQRITNVRRTRAGGWGWGAFGRGF